MLLLARDHLAKRSDLDIFSAAALVPELVALGTRSHLVPELGTEANTKLARLAKLSPDETSSTIYELLVGTALVMKGRSVQMLKPDRNSKTPDYRVSDIAGIPFVVECKRRTGLLQYERAEADAVNGLFAPMRAHLTRAAFAGIVDVEFSVDINEIGAADFEAGIGEAMKRGIATPGWGTVTIRELPKVISIPETRLYSPDMLAHVFEWDFDSADWDGLIADISATDCLVDEVAYPRCLRWRSCSSTALLKKARGITSFFGDAVQQVPAGEAGVLYIGYNEAIAKCADARTRNTLDVIQRREWYHKAGRAVPLILVSRFIAAPRGVGVPDLIESCMILKEEGWDSIDQYFPCQVATQYPDGPLSR
jgi:hypothetical protein